MPCNSWRASVHALVASLDDPADGLAVWPRGVGWKGARPEQSVGEPDIEHHAQADAEEERQDETFEPEQIERRETDERDIGSGKPASRRRGLDHDLPFGGLELGQRRASESDRHEHADDSGIGRDAEVDVDLRTDGR